MKILCHQNCFSLNRKRFNNEQNEESRFHQYLAAVCACITLAVCGSFQVWSSRAILHFSSNNTKFPVTEKQIAFIVPIYTFGDIVGALVNPLFIDSIGRKNTLLLLSLPSLIGWVLIIFAQNHIYLYIARILGGISQASAFSSLSIYLTEIAEKNIRGTLVNMIQISYYIGTCAFATIGAFATFEIYNISSAVLLIIFFLLSPLLPETPYYCLLKGRRDEAIKILMKLRGTSANKLEAEVNEMQLVIEEDKRNSKRFAFLELFRKSYNRKGLLIMFFMRATMMLSGLICMIAYAQDIFSRTGLDFKAEYQAMIFNTVALPASILTCFFIDKVNRRILFSLTGILASVCLASVGLFFFLKFYLHRDTSSIAWLPLVALCLTQIFSTSGFGIIPHISMGELFPMKVKGSATCLGRIIASVAAFATVAGYIPINNYFGIYTNFWSFALLTFVGSLLTYWTCPNTTRMSLEEIQAMQNPKLKRKLELEKGSKRGDNI